MNMSYSLCPEEVLSLFVAWTWDIPVRTALWFLTGFCTVIVATAGIVGNVYSVFMLRKFKIRKTVVIFLTALALWDASVSFCSLALYALAEMFKPFTGEFAATQYVTVIFYPISNITMTSAIWMLLIITGERYWAISNPLKHRVIDTERRAKLICTFILIASIVYCTSQFFELTVNHCIDNTTNEVISYAWGSEMRQNRLYIAIYSILLNSVFISIGPFSIMTLLTLRMIILVRNARNNRRALHCSAVKTVGNEKTTLMLLAVTGKFLLSNFLQILLNTWEALYPEMNSSIVFILFVDISNFLVVLNSASNCLVYFRWRKTLSRGPKVDNNEKTHSLSALPNANTNSAIHFGTTNSNQYSYFTNAEAAVLRSSWNTMQVSTCRFSVGRRILVGLLRRRPSFCVHLGYDNEDFVEHDQRIEVEAERITNCIEQIVNAAGHIGREEEVGKLLAKVARHHIQRKMQFNAQLWNIFKHSLIEHMNIYGDSEEEELLNKVWLKLACFVIKIMKQTYLEDRKCSDFTNVSTTNRGADLNLRERSVTISSFCTVLETDSFL